jgi:hypothetical protein
VEFENHISINKSINFMETTVIIQRVTEANGAWKWAKCRGRIRVAVVDENQTHYRKTNHKGYIKTLYESGSVDLGYTGGKWGYGYALDMAKQIAYDYANRKGLKLVE